jgi:hypothetical protein
MNYDPLTDPTSLIAYRLANRDSLAPGQQRASAAGNSASARFAVFVGAGLLIVALSLLAFL